MATMRKLFSICVKSSARFDVRPSIANASKKYHTRRCKNDFGIGINRIIGSSYGYWPWGSIWFTGIRPNYRFFSSLPDGKGDTPGGTPIDVSELVEKGDDWILKYNEVWQSRVSEAALWLDAHSDLIIVIPACSTLFAWYLLPRLFKWLHKNPLSSLWLNAQYDKSFLGALVVPARYLITFLAFLNIGTIVAPTTIATQSITLAWQCAAVISVVWFVKRWKTDLIVRSFTYKSKEGVKREILVPDASAVAMQCFMSIGRAVKVTLGGFLSRFSIQMLQSFSIGDTIKVGSVEGQVVKIGFTTTTLRTAEKIHVLFPNSLFGSEVIVNISLTKFRSMVKKVYIQIDDIDKIPKISEYVMSMLRSNSDVLLRHGPPYCFLTEFKRSSAELTFGCNLKQVDMKAELDILRAQMKGEHDFLEDKKEEDIQIEAEHNIFLKDKQVEQDIVLKVVQIIKENGVELASQPWNLGCD